MLLKIEDCRLKINLKIIYYRIWIELSGSILICVKYPNIPLLISLKRNIQAGHGLLNSLSSRKCKKHLGHLLFWLQCALYLQVVEYLRKNVTVLLPMVTIISRKVKKVDPCYICKPNSYWISFQLIWRLVLHICRL